MLRIFIQGNTNPILKDWKFNRRNINKLAYDYDAGVIKFDNETEYATLRLRMGKMMIVDTISRRFYGKNYLRTFTKN